MVGVDDLQSRSVYLTLPSTAKMIKQATQPLQYNVLGKRYLPDPTVTLSKNFGSLGTVGELKQIMSIPVDSDSDE